MFYHIISQYKSNNQDTEARNLRARKSWFSLAQKDKECRLLEVDSGVRNLNGLHHIRGLFDFACRYAEDGDKIFLTNLDSYLVSDTINWISLREFGYSERVNVRRPIRNPMDSVEAKQFGKPFCGIDLVWCTKRWWIHNREFYPDVVIGREGWDWAFKYLMDLILTAEKRGFKDFNPNFLTPRPDFVKLVASNSGSRAQCQNALVVHEEHGEGFWAHNRFTDPGQIHNRKTIRAWVEEMGFWPEILKVWDSLEYYGDEEKALKNLSEGEKPSGL